MVVHMAALRAAIVISNLLVQSSALDLGSVDDPLDTDELWIDGKPAQLAPFPMPPTRNRQFVMSALGSNNFFPLFSSHPIDVPGITPHLNINLAVVWLHGLASDANRYYADGVSVAAAAGAGTNTITIAPWFGKTMVNGSYWNADALPANATSVYWYDDVKYSHWMAGGYCSKQVLSGPWASFALLDILVLRLQDQAIFPSLKQITIAGFSAGCQLGSRWAFFSDAIVAKNVTARVQTIVADCGSYLYLDKTRPVASCRPKHDTGKDHSCSQFERPMWSRRRYYDDYHLGLSGAAEEVHYNSSQLDRYRESFPTKDVRFLVGTEDSCSCTDPEYENPAFCFHDHLNCTPVLGHNSSCCDTYPDTTIDNVAGNDLGEELQGSNRLQKGLNYVSYLRKFYNSSSFPLHGVFVGGHNSTAFGNCDVFTKWVFGKVLRQTVSIETIV